MLINKVSYVASEKDNSNENNQDSFQLDERITTKEKKGKYEDAANKLELENNDKIKARANQDDCNDFSSTASKEHLDMRRIEIMFGQDDLKAGYYEEEEEKRLRSSIAIGYNNFPGMSSRRRSSIIRLESMIAKRKSKQDRESKSVLEITRERREKYKKIIGIIFVAVVIITMSNVLVTHTFGNKPSTSELPKKTTSLLDGNTKENSTITDDLTECENCDKSTHNSTITSNDDNANSETFNDERERVNYFQRSESLTDEPSSSPSTQ